MRQLTSLDAQFLAIEDVERLKSKHLELLELATGSSGAGRRNGAATPKARRQPTGS